MEDLLYRHLYMSTSQTFEELKNEVNEIVTSLKFEDYKDLNKDTAKIKNAKHIVSDSNKTKLVTIYNLFNNKIFRNYDQAELKEIKKLLDTIDDSIVKKFNSADIETREGATDNEAQLNTDRTTIRKKYRYKELKDLLNAKITGGKRKSRRNRKSKKSRKTRRHRRR